MMTIMFDNTLHAPSLLKSSCDGSGSHCKFPSPLRKTKRFSIMRCLLQLATWSGQCLFKRPATVESFAQARVIDSQLEWKVVWSYLPLKDPSWVRNSK